MSENKKYMEPGFRDDILETVAELTVKITELEIENKKIHDLHLLDLERIEKLKERMDNFMKNWRGAINPFIKRIENLEQKVEERGENYKIYNVYTDIVNQCDANKERIEKLEKDVDDKYNDLFELFNNVVNKLSKLENRLRNDEKVNKEFLTRHEKELSELKEQIGRYNKNFTGFSELKGMVINHESINKQYAQSVNKELSELKYFLLKFMNIMQIDEPVGDIQKEIRELMNKLNGEKSYEFEHEWRVYDDNYEICRFCGRLREKLGGEKEKECPICHDGGKLSDGGSIVGCYKCGRDWRTDSKPPSICHRDLPNCFLKVPSLNMEDFDVKFVLGKDDPSYLDKNPSEQDCLKDVPIKECLKQECKDCPYYKKEVAELLDETANIKQIIEIYDNGHENVFYPDTHIVVEKEFFMRLYNYLKNNGDPFWEEMEKYLKEDKE